MSNIGSYFVNVYEFLVYVDSTIQNMLPNIGGGNFVASAIALNLASGHWTPLKNYFSNLEKGLLCKHNKRFADFNDQVLEHYDNQESEEDRKATIDKITKKVIRIFEKKIKQTEEKFVIYEKTLTRSSNLMAIISTFVLFSGLESTYNFILIYPIIAFILSIYVSHLITKSGFWITRYKAEKSIEFLLKPDKEEIEKEEITATIESNKEKVQSSIEW